MNSPDDVAQGGVRVGDAMCEGRAPYDRDGEVWPLVRLGDVAEVLYGKARPRDAGSVPVVGSGGTFGTTTESLTSGETLIIGRKGAAGAVYYVAEPCYPTDTTFYLRWTCDVCVPFVYYVLLHRGLAPDRSVIPSLPRPDVEDYLLPLPPLPEQRAIARILRCVQDAIQTRRRELELERERKAALMQHLFTKGTRGEPAKQTEIGEMPESWQVVRLGGVFEAQLGKMLSRKAKSGTSPRPYMRNANVQWGHIECLDVLEMDFDETERRKFRLKHGDILVCEGGEVGRTAIWKDELPECYFQKAIHRLRPRNGQMLPSFFLHHMERAFKWSNLYGIAGTETTIAHLPQEKLVAMQIPMPALAEQQAIAGVLDSCGQYIGTLEREVEVLEEMFRTLLEELMTGRLSALLLVETGAEQPGVEAEAEAEVPA